MNNGFDLFGADLESKIEASNTEKKSVNDASIVCEAVQIIKVVKGVMGSRREIIDTIKIDGAKMTYERALKIAKGKAQVIGNCMVVEKLERVVVGF